jgi:predicted ABC-type ATPase
MPSLFILAGANGSGKTTFYFSAKENNFVSSAVPFVNVERANLIYRERVGRYIENMQDFMIESNLAKQTDFDWLEKMKQKGYDIILFLLGTSNIEINVKRVERRVKERTSCA